MLIMSLGVPRSGTTLVFNALREILERRNVPFRTVNTNYPETEEFLSGYDFSDNVLLHAHNVLPAVQKVLPRRDVTAFFNFRDPRDVIVSMMKLHDYPFEKCLDLARISFQQLVVARKFRKIMFIPYDHLMAAPDVFIFQMAQKIGILLPLTVVEEIRAATSLEAHRKIMEDVAQEAIDVQVRKNPKRVLRESRRHFINDRHIQSGKPGRWQDELTPEQQQEATELFRPLLVELGYEAPGAESGAPAMGSLESPGS